MRSRTDRIAINIGFLWLVLVISGLTSCVKQPGCIDPNASNYTFEAEKDDGSCLYDMHFWLNTTKYEGVSIYVDNIFRGDINCVLSGEPRCGIDEVSFGELMCSVIVPLETGHHNVEVRAFDGSVFREQYYLPENCLLVLITDHD